MSQDLTRKYSWKSISPRAQVIYLSGFHPAELHLSRLLASKPRAVTNAAGQPIANRAVTLSRGQEVVASAMTQKDGTFVMKDIRPGVYELATERVASPCRIWAKPAAPPIAHHQALMVESSQIVRGQEMPPVRRALILGGVRVTSGVLGGVIGYNIQDDSAS